MYKIITYLLVCTWMFPLFASPIPKNLSEVVDSEQQEQVQLLEKLVNINSGTNNIAGVRQVGSLLENEFKALGFKTRWVEEPPALHRGPTLIAEHSGNQGKKILLIGHLDTVFPPNSSFQHFLRQGSFASGPGVVDDKGGDVVIVYALKALKTIHALDNAQITVVLTGDEEDSGKPTSISRKPLMEAAKHSDVALDFEMAITKETASIARRGISGWTIQIQAKEGHSAKIFKPSIGSGAIFEMARILNAMRLELPEEYLSFNPSLIIGGTTVDFDANTSSGHVQGKENVIPKTALTSGDLRFISAEQEKKAREKMRTIVANHLPETKGSITFEEEIPAMPPTQANLNLLNEYSQVSQALGYGAIGALPVDERGAGDISFIANMVGANLAGLGPLGEGTHTTEEKVDLNSLPMQTKRAAGLIYTLIQNN